MSTDLIQIQTPSALAALEGNLDAINEAIATNISGGGITDFDLPRVKISGGASPAGSFRRSRARTRSAASTA